MNKAVILLEDGKYFAGTPFGARGVTTGELVFNTSMTGYQEILTDPSYKGQIVTMTYPLIGNYGVNAEDLESPRPHVEGFVVRECCRYPSNWRATQSLDEYLAGETAFTVDIAQREQQGFGFTLRSELKGAGSTLPAPIERFP